MIRHTEYPSRPGQSPGTLLLGVGADPRQAALARAEGADLIDVRGATPGALAAIRASLPAAVLWTDPPGDPLDADPLDADPLDADPLDADPLDTDRLAGQAPAAVIATAAVCTWLGAPVIRSRHTRAVRRAIDMTASIAGRRPPSRTIRGLA